MAVMFKDIKECLSKYETIANSEYAKHGCLTNEEINIIDDIEFDLAKALIHEPYLDAEKIAKLILVAKKLN